MSKTWRYDPDSFEDQPRNRKAMKKAKKEARKIQQVAERRADGFDEEEGQ